MSLDFKHRLIKKTHKKCIGTCDKTYQSYFLKTLVIKYTILKINKIIVFLKLINACFIGS